MQDDDDFSKGELGAALGNTGKTTGKTRISLFRRVLHEVLKTA